MGLAAAIIIDFRESIDGPAQHRYVDSLPRAKGQVLKAALIRTAGRRRRPPG